MVLEVYMCSPGIIKKRLIQVQPAYMANSTVAVRIKLKLGIVISSNHHVQNLIVITFTHL